MFGLRYEEFAFPDIKNNPGQSLKNWTFSRIDESPSCFLVGTVHDCSIVG